MEYGLNDIVEMKKKHPCGSDEWPVSYTHLTLPTILRV